MPRKPICGGCGACARCEHAARMREWYREPGNAERQRASQRAARRRRLEAVRAYDRERGFRVYDDAKVASRSAVNKAKRAGLLVQLPCEVCGNPSAEAHHDDYAKPLEVRWLCRIHHGVVHRKVA